jgi:hypothetical protein
MACTPEMPGTGVGVSARERIATRSLSSRSLSARFVSATPLRSSHPPE